MVVFPRLGAMEVRGAGMIKGRDDRLVAGLDVKDDERTRVQYFWLE